MRRKTIVVNEELGNPLYMDEIKAYLAMNEDYRIDDEVLSAMITSARQTCENYTGISIATRTIRYEIITSGAEIRKGAVSSNIVIELPYPPIVEIEKITLTFIMANETVEFEPHIDYVVSGDQIFLIDFVVDSPLISLDITYTTGYGDKCPEAIKEVIKRLVQRSYVMKGTDLMGLTEDLALRLMPYRVGRV